MAVKLKESSNSPCARLAHVVVVRFAIGIFDERWLHHRFGLLECITAPSLRAQCWEVAELLVQVDERLDDAWTGRLRALFDGLPFWIQRLQLHGDRRRGLSDYVDSCLQNEVSQVLTTRVDDDDALSRNAMREIRTEACRILREGWDRGLISIGTVTRYLALDSVGLSAMPTEPDGVGLSTLFPRSVRENIYSWSHKKIRLAFEDQGAPHRSLAESQAQGLYTLHRMSDSPYRERRSRILKDPGSRYMKSADLEVYGVDVERLEHWRLLEAHSPILSAGKTTEALAAVERAIQEQRRRKSRGKRPEDAEEQNQQLLRERYEIGRRITEALQERRSAWRALLSWRWTSARYEP